jgi:hypothetical protein
MKTICTSDVKFYLLCQPKSCLLSYAATTAPARIAAGSPPEFFFLPVFCSIHSGHCCLYFRVAYYYYWPVLQFVRVIELKLNLK